MQLSKVFFLFACTFSMTATTGFLLILFDHQQLLGIALAIIGTISTVFNYLLIGKFDRNGLLDIEFDQQFQITVGKT